MRIYRYRQKATNTLSESDENKHEDLMEGRYRILGTLGEGGVGIVYKAQDTLLDKLVAIKKIQSKSNSMDVVRFQKEARVGGALVHPNILGVIDFGLTKENDFYLVLNFIQGESLAELLKRSGPVPLFEALDIFIQVAHGLAHAHKNKVIHRDIKPSNIMLVDDGAGGTNVQIVDFGLAKSLEYDQNLTKSGVGIGTPRYMSPEQIRGERDIGPAADVYSMGCLMFEVLTGQPAFRGDTVMETLQKHLYNEIPDLNAVSDLKFPSGMVEIVRKCLSKDADDRFSSGQDLLERLDQLLEYLQTSSGEPIDSSKLPRKGDAIVSEGSASSTEDKTLTAKMNTILHGKVPIIGAIAFATLVCLLFAVPVVSSFLESQLSPIQEPNFSSSITVGEEDKKVEGSVVEQFARQHEKIERTINDSLSQEMALVVDGSVEITPGVKNPYKAVSPANAFYVERDKDQQLRLNAISPGLADFKALDRFRGDPTLTKLKFSMSYNLLPGAIPYAVPLKIKYLKIEDSELSSETFAEIEYLSTIRHLVLANTRVQAGGFRTISKLKHLQDLELHNMKLSDDLASAVGKLRHLETLTLQDCSDITDQGFANLAGLTDLKRIHLNHLTLSDNQMSILKNLRKLELIQLGRTRITSAGLRSLEPMKWLKKINISNSPTLTRANVIRLSNALPTTKIIANDMQLYDSEQSNSIQHTDRKNETGGAIEDAIFQNQVANNSLGLSPNQETVSYGKVGSPSFGFSEQSEKFWTLSADDAVLKKLVAAHGSEIHKIQIRDGRISPNGYALLKKCPLTFLEFKDTRITADVLKAIGNLTELRTVVFVGCPDLDFAHLSELSRSSKSFHELIIENSHLTKSDITNIAKVRTVDQLKLDRCKGLSRENLSALTSLPRLQALYMVASDFTDPGFDVVKRLNLGVLAITDTKITKYGLESYLRSGSGSITVELSLPNSLSHYELQRLKRIRPDARLILSDPEL